MDAERIASLEELGFNWNRWGRNRLKIREDAWDAQFGTLLEFMKLHGEFCCLCRVKGCVCVCVCSVKVCCRIVCVGV